MPPNFSCFPMSTANAQVPLLRPGKVSRIESIIDYTFQKPEKAFLWEALQVITPTQTYVAGRYVKEANKKLAIIGDAIMAVVLAEYSFAGMDSLSSESILFLYMFFVS
jgi:dsRNA-specific ribonuclease